MPEFTKETSPDLNRTKIAESIPAGSVSNFVGILNNKKDIPVPASDILVLTLTLYDLESGLVINNRLEQSVLNENGGIVDEVGTLDMTFDEKDNVLLDATKLYETHIALFEWTEKSTGEDGKHELIHIIRNLEEGIVLVP